MDEMSFNVGDKVEIPLVKRIGCAWETCLAIEFAINFGRNYLFVVDINYDKEVMELSHNKSQETGEMFLFKDVKILTPESPTCEMIQVLRIINEEIQEESN